MQAAPLPADEPARLAALHEYQLLDTPPEELFDAFARLAANVCGTPIGLISLIDADRQWFKANHGLDGVGETRREVAFCAHAIVQDGVFEIPDTRNDERFADNPLVVADPLLRFYAGVPLVTEAGAALGTVCVLDRRPHELTAEQRTALRGIADAIVDQFEARKALLRLFDSSSTELFQVDLAAARVAFASEAARRNLGYDAADISNAPLSRIFPALENDGRYDARVRELHASPEGRGTLVTVAQRRDGTTYPIELRVELVRGKTREYALIFGTDLTERERANERISLLSAAMEAAQDPVLITTPGDGPDQPSVIVYANEAFVRQKGVQRGDVIGRSSALFHGPLTDRSKLSRMREALLSGASHRVEYITYRADGTFYHTELAGRPMRDDEGRVTHFVVVHRDITDKVMREAALEMQNERLTALTTISRELFGSLEPRGFVAALLRGMRELLGAEGRLLVRRPDGQYGVTSDLSQPRSRIGNDALIRRAASSDVPVMDADRTRAAVRITATSGLIGYALEVERETPFEPADLFALGLLGQYVAVAVRNVELYAEIADRRAAVIELNQVKNDLIAMLAHDFKGPLTTIVGFADVLAEDEKMDGESRSYLELISSSATRLASLASDTLALSRMEQNEFSLRPGPVDVVALTREVVRIFSVTRAIDLRTDTQRLQIVGDDGRLRQVLENLIGNAIKYSPGGQPVDVFVRDRQGAVEIAVRDRGIGIPERDKPRLFGRFARAGNARALGIGGTGFGLYLARTIVEAHGGTIAVESSEGAGSTFRVTLPLEPVATVGPRRVVLHEPDGDARSFVAHALRDDGAAVTVATSVAEVLAALDGAPYDVVLIDADRLDVPTAEVVDRVDGRAALVRMGGGGSTDGGWDAWLTKPILGRDLKAAIATAIARRAPRQRESDASGDPSKPFTIAAGSS